ncbi:MAG: nucleoside kinase, partial [Clostridiales bacterium]|nr:nucleoside kinase [Clostridiales bacterium]
MLKLDIFANGNRLSVNAGTSLAEIAKMVDGPHPFLVAKVGHEIMEMHRKIDRDCEIEFMDVTSDNGYRVYQRTAVFVMIKAAREVLGKKIRVVVEHSINKNYYCEIMEDNFKLTPEILLQIKEKMDEIVREDLGIVKESFLLEDGIRVAEDMHLRDKVQLLGYRTASSVNFYRLGWFYDYFYGPMAARAGVLTKFDLKMQGDGFILIFPNQNKPSQLSELISVVKLTRVFRESNNWARILNVDTVGALNDKICQGKSGEIILVTEALHEKSVAKMADDVHQMGRNVVLIAGPSSSGKTTFAQRLAVQLRVNGQKPHVISLDDYYVDRDKTPLDKFGVPNFESLYSIDVPKFNEDLQELLAGGTVHLPKYNFVTGKREYKGHFLQLCDASVLIIEGIHGLNPELSRKIPDEAKFKIFISALTQLNMDDHNRIPAADTRMIRRIVRDSQF